MLAKYLRDPAPRFNHQTPLLRFLAAVAALRAGCVMLARRRRGNAREHERLIVNHGLTFRAVDSL